MKTTLEIYEQYKKDRLKAVNGTITIEKLKEYGAVIWKKE